MFLVSPCRVGRSCDYLATLSAARGPLAALLPAPGDEGGGGGGGGEEADGARWPRTLLCASPSDGLALSAALEAPRQWLEMRKASTLAKLQFGAPYFEVGAWSRGKARPAPQRLFLSLCPPPPPGCLPPAPAARDAASFPSGA